MFASRLRPGRRRPSLSFEIDRFDRMLDGLAEAIPQAIQLSVDSCLKQAIREGIQSVIRELLAGANVGDCSCQQRGK